MVEHMEKDRVVRQTLFLSLSVWQAETGYPLYFCVKSTP